MPLLVNYPLKGSPGQMSQLKRIPRQTRLSCRTQK